MCTPLLHAEHHAQATRAPTPFAFTQSGHEAPLRVKPGQQVLEIPNPGLDLDDQERSVARTPGQDVNGAALAVVRERVLGLEFPAQPQQNAGRRLDKGRVSPVSNPVDLRGPPTQPHNRRQTHGSANRPQVTDGHAIDQPPLQSRDGLTAHPGPRSDVLLAQVAGESNLPNHPADLEVVAHAASIASATWWPLMCA